MTFSEYLKLAKRTMCWNNETQKEMIARISLGIAGESGEVCEKVKKYMRGDTDFNQTRELVSKEIGDTLWYLALLCSEEYGFNLDFDEIAKENIKKLQDRKNRNTLKGSGDNR